MGHLADIYRCCSLRFADKRREGAAAVACFRTASRRTPSWPGYRWNAARARPCPVALPCPARLLRRRAGHQPSPLPVHLPAQCACRRKAPRIYPSLQKRQPWNAARRSVCDRHGRRQLASQVLPGPPPHSLQNARKKWAKDRSPPSSASDNGRPFCPSATLSRGCSSPRKQEAQTGRASTG